MRVKINVVLGLFCDTSMLVNTKSPNWSGHDPITAAELRSAVDLMHFDCYTNGINKGRMTILKYWESVFFIEVVIVSHCDAVPTFLYGLKLD